MFKGVRKVLLPGAPLVLQVLNYERLVHTGQRSLPVTFIQDDEGEAIFLRVMTHNPDGSVIFTPSLLRYRKDGEPALEVITSHNVPLHGWKRAEMESALAAAGFGTRQVYGTMADVSYVDHDSVDPRHRRQLDRRERELSVATWVRLQPDPRRGEASAHVCQSTRHTRDPGPGAQGAGPSAAPRARASRRRAHLGPRRRFDLPQPRVEARLLVWRQQLPDPVPQQRLLGLEPALGFPPHRIQPLALRAQQRVELLALRIVQPEIGGEPVRDPVERRRAAGASSAAGSGRPRERSCGMRPRRLGRRRERPVEDNAGTQARAENDEHESGEPPTHGTVIHRASPEVRTVAGP